MAWRVLPVIVLVLTACAAADAAKYFCGNCPPQLTFREEIAAARSVVLLQRGEMPLVESPPAKGDAPRIAQFRIAEILRNAGEFRVGQPLKFNETDSSESAHGDALFYAALDERDGRWSPLLALGLQQAQYLRDVARMKDTASPEFYYEHWLGGDALLSADAQDELELLDREQLVALAPVLDRGLLLKMMQGEPTPRRRMALTLLSICGRKEDAMALRSIFLSPQESARKQLDAVVECYLRIVGESGVPLLEDEFLRNYCASYGDIYSAIVGLRTAGDAIPRARRAAALALMLDRPDLADLVIADFARMKDWTTMDRIAQLAKESSVEVSWVRVPAMRYLRECPLPEARFHLAELRAKFPTEYERLESFWPAASSPNP